MKSRKPSGVNTVYEYRYGAYFGERYSIKVLDNNTVITEYGLLPSAQDSRPIAITAETVERIREAIKEFPEVFEIEDTIRPEGMILDGAYQTICVNDGERENTVSANCLELCAGVREADIVTALHEKVSGILVEQGFAQKYLRLEPDEEEDEDRIFDFDDAVETALNINPEVDICEETEDAFIFSWPELREDLCFERGPMVVIKEGGSVVDYLYYLAIRDEMDPDPESEAVIAKYRRDPKDGSRWRTRKRKKRS